MQNDEKFNKFDADFERVFNNPDYWYFEQAYGIIEILEHRVELLKERKASKWAIKAAEKKFYEARSMYNSHHGSISKKAMHHFQEYLSDTSNIRYEPETQILGSRFYLKKDPQD